MTPARPSLRGGTTFDWAVVGLSAAMVAGAYLDAQSRVATLSGSGTLGPWQEGVAHAGWFAVTALFAVTLAWNASHGAPWQRALPPGYELSLGACLLLGLAVILDGYVQAAVGIATGLSALLSPPRVVEISAGVLIAAGPLRAAARRGETVLSVPALLSAALILAVLAFVLQFANPLVDPWAASSRRPPGSLWWVSQDLGMAGLVLQPTLIIGVLLVLIRQFELPFGSATLLCLVYGALSISIKLHYALLAVPVATGFAADLLIWRLKPGVARVFELRVISAVTPAVFTAVYFAVLALTDPTWWSFHAWAGSILAAAGAGWLMSQVMVGPRRGPSRLEVPLSAGGERWPVHEPELSTADVKAALEHLNEPEQLSRSPLLQMRALGASDGERVAELRGLIYDVVREIATSSSPRDAEAGKLLLDYYVKRVGSHDVIAERLHLTRPTFYRRLQRGLVLVVERLDELAEFAGTVGSRV